MKKSSYKEISQILSKNNKDYVDGVKAEICKVLNNQPAKQQIRRLVKFLFNNTQTEAEIVTMGEKKKAEMYCQYVDHIIDNRARRNRA